jgi:hypothetical protein
MLSVFRKEPSPDGRGGGMLEETVELYSHIARHLGINEVSLQIGQMGKSLFLNISPPSLERRLHDHERIAEMVNPSVPKRTNLSQVSSG